MSIQTSKIYYSLNEAASHARVQRQALYVAIRKGRLKAEKFDDKWIVAKDDLDEYRASKFDRDARVFQGERIYDLEKGTFSVTQVCQILSQNLNAPYPRSKLYYYMKTKVINSYRKGHAWVINREDAFLLLQYEMQRRSLF
jgi:hypothetical protein